MKHRYHYETIRLSDLNFTIGQYAASGWRVHTIHQPQGATCGVLFEKEA